MALAHVDPAFAKYQLILLCREWFENPSGALPAYEWDFGDVNPPVQAWAALEVFAVDGGRDIDFLSRVFDKLLVNFTWRVNREDALGNNLFEGGFLGLDNIGPLDRSHLPVGGTLEQSDATGWMGFYAMAMGQIAVALDRAGHAEQQPLIARGAAQQPSLGQLCRIRETCRAKQACELLSDDQRQAQHALVDDANGEGRDHPDHRMDLHRHGRPAGSEQAVVVHPVLVVPQALAIDRVPDAGEVLEEFQHQIGSRPLAGPDRLPRLLSRLFDENEFLSAHGLRSLSAYHRDHPYQIDVEGVHATIDYEPAESTTPMFGGNSNWRGPIWFPLNCLVISMLERYQRFFGDDLTIEYPTGSGRRLTFGEVASDLRDRLISLFAAGPDGRRPCFGGVTRLQDDPVWRDNLVFSEYFHGDNGAGLGASHQTGWTGLIADVIRRRHGALPSTGEVLADMGPSASKTPKAPSAAPSQ